MHTICHNRDCPLCGHYLLTVFRVGDDYRKTTLMQMTSKEIPKLIAEGEKWLSDMNRVYYQVREEV